MTTPPIYVLRHGETCWNAAGRLQGHHDSPLTEAGRAQAACQREILARCDLRGYRAYVSPQGRAHATARIALAGLIDPLHPDPALREIGLGDWAGRDRATLLAQTGARDGFALYEQAPGGEGFAALHARCAAFLAGLRTPAVLVTHGITSRMLRLILLDQPLAALPDLPGGQGVVFHLADGVQKRLTIGA